MVYNTRKKKLLEGGPAGDFGNKQINKNKIADKLSSLRQDKTNPSKEDKTNGTKHSESKTAITKTSITNELGNVNHNLDVFNIISHEDPEEFNESTIFMLDIGLNLCYKLTSSKYLVACKIGYGGSSIVWLVIDKNKHEFKIAKVFKYGYGISKFEMDIHQQTANHPNIMHFYECISSKFNGRDTCVGIYEPLGKDLYTLMKEASKHGGLSISVVKKVAIHILMALKTLHELKIIHGDIKPDNIAPCVSQQSLCCEFEKIVKSGKSLTSLRMVCQKNTEIDEKKKRKILQKEFDKITKLDNKDLTELNFKLIDFGNAMKEGTHGSTGTSGFLPPESFYGASLLPSHDIWSLGATIVVLLTNQRFIERGGDEIATLRKVFGKFSRHDFTNFKDTDGFIRKFTTSSYSSEKTEKRIKKVLHSKLIKVQMDENDRSVLIDFLLHMFRTVPNERKSAAELLTHQWLNDTLNRNPIFNGEVDVTQISSDSPKTTENSASPQNTFETSLDENSIYEAIECVNALKPLPSTGPKHSKNGGETTEKPKKKASKNNRRNDSFIYKENDGKYYLYHKYWRIPYHKNNGLFQCPKCQKGIDFKPKIGFVLVSNKKWHTYNCEIKHRYAPKKGHSFKVRMYDDNKVGYTLNDVVITTEEVDRKRESLENRGYKPILDLNLPEEICQKETEIIDDYEYNVGANSDLDETEEDYNETISEFGSEESYVRENAPYAPPWESFSNDELIELLDPELSDISSDSLKVVTKTGNKKAAGKNDDDEEGSDEKEDKPMSTSKKSQEKKQPVKSKKPPLPPSMKGKKGKGNGK